MGTRADFYLGIGKNAEWLGSIAFDGHRRSIPSEITQSTDPKKYKANVEKFIKSRDDGTIPEIGWPWPWDNSLTTDRAYGFHDGKVLMLDENGWYNHAKSFDATNKKYLYKPECPDMSSLRKKIPFGGPRSGLIVIQNGKIVEKEI